MIGNSGISGTYRDLPFLSWRVAKKVGDTYVTETTGAVGNDTLFTVTGDVRIKEFYGVCNVSVTEALAGGTIEVGISGNTAAFIALTDAELITAAKLWQDATPEANPAGVSGATDAGFILMNGADILQKITTQALSAGQIDYYCIWTPLEAGAQVTPA